MSRLSSQASPDREPRRPGRGLDARGYWRANVKLILSLLAVWAIVSYGCGILLVEWLNQYTLGNLPLGFWFAQQGSIYVFVLLILIYAVGMDRLDRRYRRGQAPPEAATAGKVGETDDAEVKAEAGKGGVQ